MVLPLYISNKLSKIEIKKTIPLTIAHERKKKKRNKFNQGGRGLVHLKVESISKRN